MTKETYDKAREAYGEILQVLNKYKESDPDRLIGYYGDIRDMADKCDKYIFVCELYDKYGIELSFESAGPYCRDYIRINDYLFIGMYGEKHRRTVGCEVDGKKPDEDTRLLNIGFPTGAYIFGDDYPTEIFNEFWAELKSYVPDYTDNINHSIYFKMENASKILKEFPRILEKYKEKNRSEFKARKIKKLQKELDKLKEN